MTKRTKLEETFDLPPIDSFKEDLDAIDEEIAEDETEFDPEHMQVVMGKVDKIDAALPAVKGLDGMDADYDEYAKKAIDAFEDLVDLGKNVEDRLAAEIFNAASSMLGNALTAKTNKAQKKIEMVKLQLQQEKVKHERAKLEYLKKRHLGQSDEDEPIETEGKIVATRNDIIRAMLEDMNKNDEDS